MTRVSLPVAKNCMMLIKNGAATDAFESLGISAMDFSLVCGGSPWIAAERGRVVNVLTLLTHGVLDVVGLPRIEVPAEFRASVLSVFVAPGNLAVACRWMETGPTAEAMSAGGDLTPVRAETLFALCLQLSDDGQALAQWEKRTGRAVRDVEGHPPPLPLEIAADA